MKTRIPWWIALPAAATGGVFLAARRLAVHENLDWDTVDKPGTIVDIDGYGVHVVERGSGPALVMLHGFGGSTFSYRKLIPYFSAHYRCIAVDLKGFGYSERDATTGLSQADQVEMLAKLLDRLGVEKAAFIGHSMGGGVVQRFAATYPQRVQAAVLMASVTGEEGAGRRAMPPVGLLRPVLPILAGFAANALLRGSFYDKSWLTPELREEYLRPARIRGSMDGLMAMMRQRTEEGSAIDYARITMPVLILSAAHDGVIPLSAAQMLRDRIPQARIVVIDRAAHLLMEERPEACARAIREFLEDAAKPAAPVAALR